MALPVAEIKAKFPIFENRRGLVYLDSAATTQKPRSVLEAMSSFYENSCANVHRGSYFLSHEATVLWNNARSKIKTFLGDPTDGEIVFTKNATEALNLAAYTLSQTLSANDLVAITAIEHHSNFVPWQQLSKRIGFKIEIIPTDEEGSVDEDGYRSLLSRGPKVVVMTHCSHVLGTILPINHLGKMAQDAGALVVVDGTQMVPHVSVDLSLLPVDLYAFSGHKMLGPNGIGCLFGRRKVLEKLPPFLFGGDMVFEVTECETSFQEIPRKFEAGTPATAEAIGLGAATDFLSSIGMDAITLHKKELTEYLVSSLSEIEGLKLYGPRDLNLRAGIASFSLSGIHPHDIAEVLNTKQICVRSGQHCAQPLMRKLELEALTRVSVYLYNERSDIDALCNGLRSAQKLFL